MFSNTSSSTNTNHNHINTDDEYVNNSKLQTITTEDMNDALIHLKRLNSKT